MKNLFRSAFGVGDSTKFVWRKLEIPKPPERPDISPELQTLQQDVEKQKHYKEVYAEIVIKDMDLPDDNWNDVYKIPRTEFITWLKQAGTILGWNDQVDLERWTKTTDGREFLNRDYKDLNDYVAKKAIQRQKELEGK